MILNLPHPRGLCENWPTTLQQQKASQYARNFQKPDAAKNVAPGMLTSGSTIPEARTKYLEAFKRSSMEGMLNYYKANYPREALPGHRTNVPAVKCPVLMIHGLKDTALLPGA